MADEKATEKSDVAGQTGAAAAKATKPAAAKKAAAAKADAPAKAAVVEPAGEAPKAKAKPAKATTSKTKAASTKKVAEPEGHGGTLRVHHLRPAAGAHTPKTRVGRGEGGARGKTAGRGTKGTKARYQVPTAFEGGQMPLHMRLPKLRGFKNPFRTEYQVVNLERLAELYPAGGDVTVSDLVAKGAVRKGSPVKVLGTGDVSVKLAVAVDALSTSAREKILAAGGSVTND